MATSALRKRIPLQTRKILKKGFGSFIRIFFVGGLLSLGVLAGLDPNEGFLPQRMIDHRDELYFIWFSLLAVMMFWKLVYEYIYFVTYYYDLDESNVVIRKGIISTKEVTLPFARITDVYVDQDLIDVCLGLYDVHISTPTQESGTFAHIDGVNKAGAKELRQIILEHINKKAA